MIYILLIYLEDQMQLSGNPSLLVVEILIDPQFKEIKVKL